MQVKSETVMRRPGVSSAKGSSNRTAVEKIWPILDSQDRILALAFRVKSSKPLKDSGLGGVPREQTMIQRHLSRVIYHEVY